MAASASRLTSAVFKRSYASPRTRWLLALLAASLLGSFLLPTGLTSVASATAASTLMPAAGQYMPIPAVKMLDTRGGSPVAADDSRTVQIAGKSGVAADATGVAIILSSISPGGAGYLTAYPSDQVDPSRSTVRFQSGQNDSGSDDVALDSTGALAITNHSGQQTDITLTVTGYFTSGAGSAAGTTYVPVTESQVVDTRSTGYQVPKGQIPAQGSVTIDTTKISAVPSSNVDAVAVTLGAVDTTAIGSLNAYASSPPPGNPAILWYAANEKDRNTVIVPVSSSGTFVVANGGSAPIDLTIYIEGYFQDPAGAVAGATFTAVTPKTVLDTRGAGRVAANGSVTFQQTGKDGVPATGVSAVVDEVNAVQPQADGWITGYPTGTTDPDLSTVNFAAGDNGDTGLDNAITSKVSPGGQVTLSNHSAGAIDIVVTVRGYWGSASVPASVGSPTITSSTSTSATISWGTPATDGGARITGYRLTTVPATSVTTASSTASSAVVSGLASGTTYIFFVAATNGAGNGPATGTSGQTIPGMPSALSAYSGDGSVSATWTNASVAGVGLTGVTASVTDQTGSVVATQNLSGAATTATFSGLTNGSIYQVLVSDSDGAGVGAQAASDPVVPAASAVVSGSAVTAFDSALGGSCPSTGCPVQSDANLKIGQQAGSQWQTLLQFNLSSIPAGAIILGATLNMGSESCVASCTDGGTISAYLLTSPWSSSSNGSDINNSALADPIATSTASSPGVLHLDGTVADWLSGDNPNDGLEILDSSQTDGSAYSFSNSGATAPKLTITYVTPQAPTAPENVSVESSANGLEVTWTPSAASGNAQTQPSYTVTAATASGVAASTTSTGDRVYLGSLQNGTSYQVTVSAVTGYGTTAAAAVTATPNGLSQPASSYESVVNDYETALARLHDGSATTATGAVQGLANAAVILPQIEADAPDAVTADVTTANSSNSPYYLSGETVSPSNWVLANRVAVNGTGAVDVLATIAVTDNLTDPSGASVDSSTTSYDSVDFEVATDSAGNPVSLADVTYPGGDPAEDVSADETDPSDELYASQSADNANLAVPTDTLTLNSQETATDLATEPVAEDANGLAADSTEAPTATGNTPNKLLLYDGVKVATWADNHYNDILGWDFPSDNCTDFASKSIHAAMPMVTNRWYYWHSWEGDLVSFTHVPFTDYLLSSYSRSWSIAPALMYFLMKHEYSEILHGKNQLQRGDIIFYSKTHKWSGIYHTQVVVRVHNGVVRIAQWGSDKEADLLSEERAAKKQGAEHTYFIRPVGWYMVGLTHYPS